jgi:hypothetical protein
MVVGPADLILGGRFVVIIAAASICDMQYVRTLRMQ